MRLKRQRLNERHVTSAINKSLMYSLARRLMHTAVITFDFICLFHQRPVYLTNMTSATHLRRDVWDGGVKWGSGKCAQSEMWNFEFACVFFPPPFCRNTLCCCLLHPTLTKTESKQKIPFYAHLLSEVTEVSKVWLLHFILGSFL